MRIHRRIEAIIPVTVTLAIAAAIVMLTFYLASSLGSVRQVITGNALAIGISLMLIGILVMMSRRKALMQMVGLFASENGIFFTAMAVSQGMPLIIEIGITLDVILGALVMGVIMLRVKSSIGSDIADLNQLKG
jgi:hydrogenase-4 component E